MFVSYRFQQTNGDFTWAALKTPFTRRRQFGGVFNLKTAYYVQASVTSNKYVINHALTSDTYICLYTWYTVPAKKPNIYFLFNQ